MDRVHDQIATDNIEPIPAIKTGGVPDGGTLGREHLNWMFNAFSQWIDWVRSSALDKDNNLSDLTNVATARTNLGLMTSATTIGANTTGNAQSATTVNTTVTDASGTWYPTFVNNATNGVNSVYKDSGLKYYPSSNNLECSVFTGILSGNSSTTTKLSSPKTIALAGDVSGSTSFDGSSNVTITASVGDNSHNHSLSTLPNFKYGVRTVAANSTDTVGFSSTVVTAMACQNSTSDLDSGGIGVTWSGSNITLRNSYGAAVSIVYWVWVS